MLNCIWVKYLLLQEGSQRPDKLLLVDVFYCYTTAWHLEINTREDLLTVKLSENGGKAGQLR